eukprot:5142095-Prorocentrum_lima.AAC.1
MASLVNMTKKDLIWIAGVIDAYYVPSQVKGIVARNVEIKLKEIEAKKASSSSATSTISTPSIQ